MLTKFYKMLVEWDEIFMYEKFKNSVSLYYHLMKNETK